MPRHAPPAALLLGLGLVICLGLSGCDDAATRRPGSTDAAIGRTDTSDRFPPAPEPPAAASDEYDRFAGPAEGLNDLDLGGDWDRRLNERAPAGRTLAGQNAVTSAATADESDEPHWAIVLQTFSGDDHLRQAQQTLPQIRALSPILQSARLHRTLEGSMILLGRYDALRSEPAQRDLEAVQSIRITARDPRTGRTVELPAFPRAMIGRIKPDNLGAQLHALDLMNLRRQYPNVDPLYTLDVAIWLTGEDSRLTMDEARRRAIAYARELRGQGLAAFFHVDADKGIATVTVGAFGRDAVDPQSGFVSHEVQAVMKRFPGRLVNGEPLEVPISARRPDLGTRRHEPVLVLVPEL